MARSGENTATSSTRPLGGAPILLYDGSCGLCHRLVRFVLGRDARDRFRFAALQGDFARRVLLRHGLDPDVLDTSYAVLDLGAPTERVLERSDASLAVLRELGGVWRLVALARFLPRAWRDRGYDLVARNRQRLFGRRDACSLPAPEQAWKFVEVEP